MTWYTAMPGMCLLAGPLRLALAHHLGIKGICARTAMPLHPLNYRADVWQTTWYRACSCAHGPSLRRHNRLRDQWVKLCRQAGWHMDSEQVIRTHETDSKRADLVALTRGRHATRCRCHGHCNTYPLGTAGEHLRCSEAAKASRYHAHAWGDTRDGTTVVPLIHDALCHWLSPAALRLCTAPPGRHNGPPRCSRGPHCLGRSLPPSPHRLGSTIAPHFLCRRMAASRCLR